MFSLRIDQLYEEMIYNDSEADSEITMMEIFDNFTERFECENFIFAFEDRDKTGQFPRKPHYHALFRTATGKADTMRRWLKKYGFHKETAGIHTIKDDEEWEKATLYTLKQQSVVFTDIDETILDSLKIASANYNYELDKSKNIAVEILENVVTTMKAFMEGSNREPSRLFMAEAIYDEYNSINEAANNWQQHYCYPVGQQLLRMIHYVESKVLLSSRDRWLRDNMNIINPEQVREQKRMERRNVYQDIYSDNE